MKIQHLLLSAALAASLTACTSPESTPAGDATSATTSEAKPTEAAQAGENVTEPTLFKTDYVTVKNKFGKEPTFDSVKKAEVPTGLVIEDMSPGDGDEVKENSNISFNYAGYSLTTGKVFDSSFSSGKPLSIGLDNLVQGMQQGLLGMKVGGRRVLVIPPDMGYGDKSPTADIAPNDTLVFVVDLLSSVTK